MRAKALIPGKRALLAAAAAVALGTTMAASGGRAAPGPAASCPLGMTGTSYSAPPGGTAYTVCTGRLASFDGTPLDTDLTLPATGPQPRPLIVMLHGWG